MLPISAISPQALPTKPPSSNTPVHVAVLHLLSKPPFTFKTPNKQINTCPDEQSWNTKTGWQDNDQEEVKCRLWVCTGDTPSPCSSHPAGSRTHLNSSALAPSAGGAENNTPKDFGYLRKNVHFQLLHGCLQAPPHPTETSIMDSEWG